MCSWILLCYCASRGLIDEKRVGSVFILNETKVICNLEVRLFFDTLTNETENSWQCNAARILQLPVLFNTTTSMTFQPSSA